MKQTQTIAIWILGSLFALACTLAITLNFSFDMDEFLPYHTIACQQPGQESSVYQGACNVLPTEILGWKYQRSFNYAGAMSAWIMTPVFALWHSWWAHALVGIVSLGLTAWGVVQSLGISRPYIVTGMAMLPLAFPIIHDTGPVRLSIIVIAWSPHLLRYILSPRPNRWRIAGALLLSFGWLASTENKPFFLFLIPGTFIWILACLYKTEGTSWIKVHVKGVTGWFVGLGISCASLLLIIQVQGSSYFNYLREFPSPNDPLVNAGTALTFFGNWTYSAQRFTLNYPNVDSNFPALLQSPLNALPLSADRGAPLALILTIAALIAVSLFLVWIVVRIWRYVDAPLAVLLIGSALILLMGAWVSGGGSVHHYVFAQVPVLGAIIVAFATTKAGAGGSLITVAILSVLGLLAIATTERNPAVGPNVEKIMETAFAAANSQSIINCSSWGCYHQFAFLANKPAPVVFAESPDEMIRLASDARVKGLTIINVCRDCAPNEIKSIMGASDLDHLPSSEGGWLAFRLVP